MKVVDYEDAEGRFWRVRVPDDCPPELYPSGVLIGPPAGLDEWLTARGWSEAARVRLHNQLHSRGLFTLREATKRGGELQAALQAALRTDIQGLQAVYYAEAGGK